MYYLQLKEMKSMCLCACEKVYFNRLPVDIELSPDLAEKKCNKITLEEIAICARYAAWLNPSKSRNDAAGQIVRYANDRHNAGETVQEMIGWLF